MRRLFKSGRLVAAASRSVAWRSSSARTPTGPRSASAARAAPSRGSRRQRLPRSSPTLRDGSRLVVRGDAQPLRSGRCHRGDVHRRAKALERLDLELRVRDRHDAEAVQRALVRRLASGHRRLRLSGRRPDFRSWTSSGIASVHVLVDTVNRRRRLRSRARARTRAAGWNAGCTSSICGTAADSGGSGLQKVEVSIRRGSGNYWDGVSSFSSGSQVWNLVTGAASWTYSFPASNFPADGTYTVEVRATDNALNVQSPVTSQAFTFDTTPPVIGASAIAATTGTSPAGFVKQGGGYNIYADASDASPVSSVTANVSSVTTAQTAVALPVCACELHRRRSHVRLQERTAHREHAARPGEQELHGECRRRRGQCQCACQLQRAGGQHRSSLTTVIAATTGTSPQGFVKQGGTYRVYANATDLPSGSGQLLRGQRRHAHRQRLHGDAPARPPSPSPPAAPAARARPTPTSPRS